MTPEEILKKYWGFDSFRPMQREVIDSVLSDKDTLAVMPTGGGKSVCFQIPALMRDGLCLVVSPLIALMKDQVMNLKKAGILSLAIHSGQHFHDVRRNLENAIRGNYRFLYVSPERLETSLFQEYLPYLNINLLAVDEAHCISQWGYDFRPSYLRIAIFRDSFPSVPILALTASATKKVQQDICNKLHFGKNSNLFTLPYSRKNLSYSVLTPQAKEKKITEIFSSVPGSGIVYCRTRKRSENISGVLDANGFSTDWYHAGILADDREKKQENWTQDRIRIICCTNAFGMGIDKSNVRAVVHFDLPDALEYYYQQAGRAGRDDRKAYAVLLYYPDEIERLKQQIKLRFPDTNTIRKVYSLLCAFIGLPAGKGKGLYFDLDMGRFITAYKLNPLLASSVIKILEQEEILLAGNNLFDRSSAGFLVSKETIEQFEKDYPQYDNVIKGLLRSYEGIFEQPAFIDEYELARFVHMKKADVIGQLQELDRLKIIEYHPVSDLPGLIFLEDRVPSGDLLINEKNILLRKKAYQERLDAMIGYATQQEECRSIYINRYFGGATVPACGICDICLSKKSTAITAEDVERVTKIIKINRYRSISDIASASGLTKNKVSEALYFLSGEGKIIVNEDGKIKYITP